MAGTTANIDFDASKLAKEIELTIHVKGMNIFRVRLWIGMLFFRLGAWIAGVGSVKVEAK